MRYFLDADQCGHWFIIPAEKRDEWNEFINVDEDDPAGWEMPEWVIYLNGSPTRVTFENFIIDKK